MSDRSKTTISTARQAQKKGFVQDLFGQGVDCGRALVHISPSGAIVQPIPGASTPANTAFQAENKVDNPKGVQINGDTSGALAVGGNVKTHGPLLVKAETPEAARKRAKLQNKEQPKCAPQPLPGAVGVFIGGNTTRAIVVGEDLEAKEGITIE